MRRGTRSSVYATRPTFRISPASYTLRKQRERLLKIRARKRRPSAAPKILPDRRRGQSGGKHCCSQCVRDSTIAFCSQERLAASDRNRRARHVAGKRIG